VEIFYNHFIGIDYSLFNIIRALLTIYSQASIAMLCLVETILSHQKWTRSVYARTLIVVAK